MRIVLQWAHCCAVSLRCRWSLKIQESSISYGIYARYLCGQAIFQRYLFWVSTGEHEKALESMCVSIYWCYIESRRPWITLELAPFELRQVELEDDAILLWFRVKVTLCHINVRRCIIATESVGVFSQKYNLWSHIISEIASLSQRWSWKRRVGNTAQRDRCHVVSHWTQKNRSLKSKSDSNSSSSFQSKKSFESTRLGSDFASTQHQYLPIRKPSLRNVTCSQCHQRLHNHII